MLYQAEGLTGDFHLVYNGSINALQRHFNSTGLKTGQLYQFRVEAVNFNGPSEPSDILSAHACMAPDPPLAPRKVTSDSSSVTIAW